jgi:autotransporter strand-loop-strand O-heptosyltransferase
MNKITINNIDYDLSSPNDKGFREQYITSFGDKLQPTITITATHVDGFSLTLSTETNDEYDVEIYDGENELLYKTKLGNNMFSKLNRKYYKGIYYKIFKDGQLIHEKTYSFENRRVFIAFDSSSLGDTISWVTYCEEFRNHHNCEVVVSTFHNFLFEKTYPNIEFVKPGSVVHNIHAMFRLGWFYDDSKEPQNPQSIPLQKAATNILGLPYKEQRTFVHIEPKERIFKEKYVCIATNSTAGCKLWNNPTGWSDLTEYLIGLGYRVINISKDGDKIKGVTNLKDDSLENTMSVIYHSEFVIGLSSGLSWLSWGLGKHVVMISNFTEPDHEFTENCTRIINTSVCNGCWNNPMFKFDKGDWYWCPEHKGTDRQFECHKSITSKMVIDQIQHLLK